MTEDEALGKICPMLSPISRCGGSDCMAWAWDQAAESASLAIDRQLVADLALSVRAANCLKNAEIVTVGDLHRLSDRELLRIPNFGRHSLQEVRALLQGLPAVQRRHGFCAMITRRRAIK